jgi:predicted amidohydrolase
MSRPLRLGVHAWRVAAVRTLNDYAQHLDRVVAAGAAGAELLLLPEYACMEAAAAVADQPTPAGELAAACRMQDQLLEIMIGCAQRHKIWLMPGSLPFEAQGRIYNRAPLITPEGRMAFQDKRVMTRFEAESWGVRAGAPPGVFDTPWGIIGASICYDCEFPMLTRAQVARGAWVILVPACTDTLHGFNRVRISARARALENQCFVAVAPTVGLAPWSATLDENHGKAGIYGPIDRGFSAGGVIAEGEMDAEGWVFATLDPASVETVRAEGAVLNHADWPAAIGPSKLHDFL